MREYSRRPEVKKRAKEYNKRIDVIARRKYLREIPEKRDRNKHKRKEISKRYRKLNPQKIRLSNELQYKKNRLKRLTYAKEYRIQNPNKRKEYERNRKKNDKSYLIKCRLRNRLSKVFFTYIKTGKTKTSKLYGVDFGLIINRLKPFPKDIHLYHIDHITPLASFNFNDPEQIKLAFAPENHEWLLASNNLSKGAKIEIQSTLI